MGRIKVKESFLLLLSILLIADEQGILFLFLLAAAIHEAGHALAIYLCGGRITMIELTGIGAVMRYTGAAANLKLFCIATAGPCAGLLTALFCAHFEIYTFAGINILLSLFNLLPIKPLDGWTALNSLCFVPERISILCASILLLIGLWCWKYTGSICVFAAGGILLYKNTCKTAKKRLKYL